MYFLKKYWDKIFLVTLILVYVCVFSGLSIARHDAFASGFDLGNMDQTVWNTLHGKFYALTGDSGTISRFSIHADPILVLLSPFYLLWDNVRMLLILQSIFIGLSAIPIYLLARKIIKDKFVSVVLPTIFLLVPGVEWTNIYDFHPSALAIFFFLSAFYFAWIKKWRWYTFFMLLLLMCKETTSLTIAMLGFLMVVILREYKAGLISLFVGLAWFILMINFVIPYFSPNHKYWALSWVQLLNSSENNNSFTIGEQKMILRFILASDAKKYFIDLLKPYAFFPLLGIPWLLLIIPRLSINLISSQAQMRSVFFHYDSIIQAGLIIATIFSIHHLALLIGKTRLPAKIKRFSIYPVVILIIIFALRVNYHYSPLPTTPACWCLSYRVTDEDREFEKLLRSIPRKASVTASPEIRPHITHRENAFTLPTATASADFIALIDQNRMVGDYNDKDYELVLRDQLKTSKKYKLTKHIGHFYLYEKNSSNDL